MTGPPTARYAARFAETAQDVARAQRLRFRLFRDGDGLDTDEFDPICQHVLVEEVETGLLVCCFRFLPLADGSEISRSYSAKYYDLSALEAYPGAMVEMGRFCVHPGPPMWMPIRSICSLAVRPFTAPMRRPIWRRSHF